MRLLRIVEIAEILGVSKQRTHQLADEERFPDPVERDGRGRLWNRRQVEAWAILGAAAGRAREQAGTRAAFPRSLDRCPKIAARCHARVVVEASSRRRIGATPALCSPMPRMCAPHGGPSEAG